MPDLPAADSPAGTPNAGLAAAAPAVAATAAPADAPALRIVVMGTGPFAVPMFRRLLASRHRIVALVTRPDRAPAGRRPPPNPMRAAAEAAGVPVLAPERINDPAAIEAVRGHAPDLLVVCDYGQILSPAALSVAALGGVNLHGSLLPRHRGAAPVQWAILAGDAVSGVSVIHMSPALDAGHVLATAETPIGATETAAELEPRLAALGAEIVPGAIDQLARGGPGATPGAPQDPAAVTRAPRLTKADGIVDWSLPAARIERMRRALEPWPRATAFLHAGGAEAAGRPPLRIVLEEVAVADAPLAEGPADAAAGTILAAGAEGIVVACGAGTRLVVRRLVPEGRRGMSAAEFLRGHALFAAARFGPPGPPAPEK
jgi:methionyl-tRNA formyltransferase